MSNDKRNKVLECNKKKRFRFMLIIPALLLVGGVFWFTIRGPEKNEGTNIGIEKVPYGKISAGNGVVTLPAADFDDGTARHYTYQFPEKDVYFFIVKSSDGVVRAAFDACDVCFRARKGYTQAGSIMVCNNCGQQFPTALINVEKGGCNPSPLDRALEGENIVINVSDIYKGLKYF